MREDISQFSRTKYLAGIAVTQDFTLKEINYENDIFL